LEVPRPVAWGFLSWRFLQNFPIFIFAGMYYRSLGLSRPIVLLAMNILAWGMSQALYDSDLSFNTYMDLLLYLVAAFVLVRRRYEWIILISILSALNRETGALIPVLSLAIGLWIESNPRRRRCALWASLIGAALFVGIYGGIRAWLGPRELFHAFDKDLGLPVFVENVARLNTWARLAIMFGILPYLAFRNWRRWSTPLKCFGCTLLPVWIAIHFLASVVAETRLFLVPLAIVLIPGALLMHDDHRAHSL
jgi:hypothetical protein